MRVQCNDHVCSVYDLVDVHAPLRKLEKPAQLLWSALSRYRSVSDVVRCIADLPSGRTHGPRRHDNQNNSADQDPLSGFWAASERNGYEVRLVWAMASDALARIFALTPAEVRGLASTALRVASWPTTSALSKAARQAPRRSRPLSSRGWAISTSSSYTSRLISETRAQKRAQGILAGTVRTPPADGCDLPTARAIDGGQLSRFAQQPSLR